MSELDEFKKVVSPIAYGLAYKSKLGTTEYQQLYAEEDVIKYFNNKPSLTIPKSIADELEKYDFELTSKGLMYSNMGGTLVEFSRVTYDEIPQLIVQTIAGNYRIVFAYLAGKALGVDLVKVGEG
ncbi:hypothetical protein [Lactococcus lactis]|uniref:Phage protein n=1 Tax=Lactococcus lactis subsp. lactis TaxID=1360 RepID=A0A2N5WB40_LACLL|nr:hypothetical protein [Lactococcus lactis]PLW59456.1 hypothetical protein CYU10_000318 [Lactococcus lactis subsp. lactis]